MTSVQRSLGEPLTRPEAQPRHEQSARVAPHADHNHKFHLEKAKDLLLPSFLALPLLLLESPELLLVCLLLDTHGDLHSWAADVSGARADVSGSQIVLILALAVLADVLCAIVNAAGTCQANTVPAQVWDLHARLFTGHEHGLVTLDLDRLLLALPDHLHLELVLWISRSRKVQIFSSSHSPNAPHLHHVVGGGLFLGRQPAPHRNKRHGHDTSQTDNAGNPRRTCGLLDGQQLTCNVLSGVCLLGGNVRERPGSSGVDLCHRPGLHGRACAHHLLGPHLDCLHLPQVLRARGRGH
mmetsp:Transcript_67870/g.113749  ORF Transcript_67870/g.113749 Transcript_67870/m.113749 type:complete len:296 (-) Transcript_67870:119-1006(-)